MKLISVFVIGLGIASTLSARHPFEQDSVFIRESCDHENDPFADLAMSTAALALQLSGHTSNVQALQQIALRDLSDIHQHKTETFESYYATLPNGDSLSCDYFIGGPCKGQISCTRFVRTDNGMTVFVPIRASLFYQIKQAYQDQNPIEKA